MALDFEKPDQTDKIQEQQAITRKYQSENSRLQKTDMRKRNVWHHGKSAAKEQIGQYTHVKHKCCYPISSLELSMMHVLFFRLRKAKQCPAFYRQELAI